MRNAGQNGDLFAQRVRGFVARADDHDVNLGEHPRAVEKRFRFT